MIEKAKTSKNFISADVEYSISIVERIRDLRKHRIVPLGIVDTPSLVVPSVSVHASGISYHVQMVPIYFKKSDNWKGMPDGYATKVGLRIIITKTSGAQAKKSSI